MSSSSYSTDLPSLSSIKPASKTPLIDKDVAIFEQIFNNDSYSQSSNIPQINWLIKDEIGYIDDVITKQECNQLIDVINNHNSLSFWSDKGRDNQDTKAFRDADTIEIHSQYISNILWIRIKSYINHISYHFNECDDGSEAWQVDLIGDWTSTAINHDLLLARYPSGGYFSPHTDGNVISNYNQRSFFSVIIFLNDVPYTHGGGIHIYTLLIRTLLICTITYCILIYTFNTYIYIYTHIGTKFYQDEASKNLHQSAPDQPWIASDIYCINEVNAVAGRFLFFNQKYVHEGVIPQAPYMKYIIRTDIMFTRSPLLLTAPEDTAAYALHQQAEVLAELGHTAESVKMFRAAFKMSPALSRAMGQS